MLLKECVYSKMIDYDSPTFQETLASYGNGSEDITSIHNLELAYKVAGHKTFTPPNLSKIWSIALYGDNTDKLANVRENPLFLSKVKTNIKSYNPTAPDEILPALADIAAYLYNDKDTDLLIKAALVHYQFEMIHPFEQYNGVVGRIIVSMILQNSGIETMSPICLSEYFYYNKNEYFDLLRTTQYSGGYARWIKFFVKAIGETAKQSAESLIQYEHTAAEDEQLLMNKGKISRSTSIVFEYFKRFPITSISYAAKGHVVVLGTAGSGKTTIAMLRAHHLANIPAFPIQYDQLVQHLIPSAVSLGPLPGDVFTGQVKHLFQGLVTEKLRKEPEVDCEKEALEMGYPVAVGRFQLSDNGKAFIDGADRFIKVVIDKETWEIPGIHMVGQEVSSSGFAGIWGYISVKVRL